MTVIGYNQVQFEPNRRCAMLIAMSMDTGVSAKSRRDEDESQEIRGVEWNPVMANLQEAAEETGGQRMRRHAMPACVAEIDVDVFLREMAAIQR